ncbi:MAG: hypothetical protein J6S00_03780, partial [Clostridia bacterium]|nr:hypothetical protein [Clostridia bacterium]
VAFDTLYSSEILGSLAGDDTIIVVTKSEADSKSLAAQLLNLIK